MKRSADSFSTETTTTNNKKDPKTPYNHLKSLETGLRAYSKRRNSYSAKGANYVRPARVSGAGTITSPSLFACLLSFVEAPLQAGVAQKIAPNPVSYQEGQANHFPNCLQLQVTETKFLVTSATRWAIPLPHSVLTYARGEALPWAGQSENKGPDHPKSFTAWRSLARRGKLRRPWLPLPRSLIVDTEMQPVGCPGTVIAPDLAFHLKDRNKWKFTDFRPLLCKKWTRILKNNPLT